MLSLPAVVHSAQGHFAHKLLNDLMENYSSALRPVDDTDQVLNVTLQITLSQIKDMVSASSSARSSTLNPKVLILYTVYFNKISISKTKPFFCKLDLRTIHNCLSSILVQINPSCAQSRY